jgi:hypothetical protein
MKSLRVYDTAGNFIRKVGAAGSGPGEYTTVNAMAVLQDGSVLLCDSGRAKLVAYRGDGTHLADWKLTAERGLGTSCSADGLHADTSGLAYIRRLAAGDQPSMLVGITTDAEPRDSLEIPYHGLSAPRLSASATGTGGSSSRRAAGNLFSPRERTALSPLGYVVWGRSDRYAIHLLHRDGAVTRIERTMAPVPYDPAERDEMVNNTTEFLRCVDPRWTHPDFPENKEYFRSLKVGNDGRIWVQVTTPSELIPDDEIDRSPYPVDCPPSRPIRRFRERQTYDVFEPSGEFLGRLTIPDRAVLLAMEGDYLWLRSLDENDVHFASRFRVRPPFGQASR